MKTSSRFEVWYSEWIGRGRKTEAFKCFGPASRAECEKYTEKYDNALASWSIREAL